MATGNKTKWYIGGLHFECAQCGRCCAGPDEGYIWITRPEIEFLTKHLGITLKDARCEYLQRVGIRTTIIEEPRDRDCIFLNGKCGQKGCAIYPVRPNQCRTWPFWTGNIARPDDWNMVAQKCPGINRGRLYTFEEIEKIRKQRKWWPDASKR